MLLADLSLRLRRERVATALDIALRDQKGTASTSELVERLCGLLETEERRLVAKAVLDLAEGHPLAKAGEPEPVKRYGKTLMVRRVTWGVPDTGPLIRCPHCDTRDFPANIKDGRCPACQWAV